MCRKLWPLAIMLILTLKFFYETKAVRRAEISILRNIKLKFYVFYITNIYKLIQTAIFLQHAFIHFLCKMLYVQNANSRFNETTT